MTVAAGPIRLPCRIVHMFSEQPQPTIKSAPEISSAASGEANPPLTSRSHGLPRNSPLAAAEVASSAPHAAASRSRSPRAWAMRAPRPATKTGRRAMASRPASASAAPADGATGPSTGRRRWLPVALARLHVQRHGQYHGAALQRGRLVGPRGVGGRRGGGVQPCRHRADRGGHPGHVDPEVGVDRRAWLTSAASTSSGVRLLAASVIPVIALVSPGPWCTVSSPARPAVRAQPSAMPTAPPSCRAAMYRVPWLIIALVSWKLPLPTTPNGCPHPARPAWPRPRQ